MGILDFLTSTKRPAAGTAVLPAEDAGKRLLELNRTTAPCQLIDGASEGVDVIAEWNTVSWSAARQWPASAAECSATACSAAAAER